MLKLGTTVRYRPCWPGDVWDTEPWWICGRCITEDHWRQPVVFYKVARLTDPAAKYCVDVCVREDQLLVWDAATPPVPRKEPR